MKLLDRVGLVVIGGFAVAASFYGCSSGPTKPGDACNPDPDNCPPPLTCGDLEGQNLCLITAGEPCELTAEKAYCAGDGTCEDDGTGEGVCVRHIDEGGECDPANEYEKCNDGLVCAEMLAGGHKCYAPVLLKGKVFDAADEGAIEGARVIALNEVATAVTDVAISDAKGEYILDVPVAREEDGSPSKDKAFTLRASAQDYQTFPGGLRTALPILSSEAASKDGAWVIDSALTDVALIGLPDDQTGLPSISGSVLAGDSSGGVLVVAESGGKGISAISDKKGVYTIFNVPAGSYDVSGYAAGVQLKSAATDVDTKDVTGVDLGTSEDALGSISGKLSIVNGGDGKATSVVLVVESTFSDTFVRGEVPRGLRTPLQGTPNVTGDFTIKDVPAGRYVVLAAFENDLLVRDPDTNIAGTQIVHQEMPAPGQAITLASSFKITGALTVFGPGAEDPEGVTAAPMLTWADDSSEDFYRVVVYNAYGEVVWQDDNIPSVSGGGMVSVAYGGPLDKGMYYQFRASSWRNKGGMESAISTTEDLRGVFFGQ